MKITPLGSSYDDVYSTIINRKWKINNHSKTSGFYDQRNSNNKVVGAMSIRASLGDYQGFPFSTNVTVFWGFDTSGTLIDVWLWTTSDGL
jgi:hypothetical protein